MAVCIQTDLFRPLPPTWATHAGADRRVERETAARALSINSVRARERNADAFHGRKALIIDALTLYGPMTDRQLRDKIMGSGADMNTIRPRVSELLGEKPPRLVEVGSIVDETTGEDVRMVWLGK